MTRARQCFCNGKMPQTFDINRNISTGQNMSCGVCIAFVNVVERSICIVIKDSYLLRSSTPEVYLHVQSQQLLVWNSRIAVLFYQAIPIVIVRINTLYAIINQGRCGIVFTLKLNIFLTRCHKCLEISFYHKMAARMSNVICISVPSGKFLLLSQLLKGFCDGYYFNIHQSRDKETPGTANNALNRALF